jgi:hypothetical protein
MAIKQEISIHFYALCDLCDKELTDEFNGEDMPLRENVTDLLEDAKDHGWVIDGSVLVCKDCQTKTD